MDIDYPDKRKFCKKIGCSIATKSALFLTERQKPWKRIWSKSLGTMPLKTPGFNELVGRPLSS